MGKYQALTDGRAIAAAARHDIDKAGLTLDLFVEWKTQYPQEHRAQVRREQIFTARQALEEGRNDLLAWADATRASASRRLAKRDTGSPAEESRRVAAELRIGRLVAAGAANPRGAAEDLQERAATAYAKGNTDEASIYAQAAKELAPGAASLAGEILGNIDADEILADPDRAKALRQLNDVDVVLAAAERDLQASYSKALQQSARLAQDLGDSVGQADALKEATQAGIRAKLGAFAASQQTGEAYVEPAGVVPGLPQDLGISQPAGAHLGGATVPEGGAA